MNAPGDRSHLEQWALAVCLLLVGVAVFVHAKLREIDRATTLGGGAR